MDTVWSKMAAALILGLVVGIATPYFKSVGTSNVPVAVVRAPPIEKSVSRKCPEYVINPKVEPVLSTDYRR